MDDPHSPVQHASAHHGALSAQVAELGPEWKIPTAPEMRELCILGIPPELRQRAWPMLLSMRAPLEPSATEYRLLRQAADERRAERAHLRAAARAREGAAEGSQHAAGASRQDSADSAAGAAGAARAPAEASEEADSDSMRSERLIETDLSRTFPKVLLFAEGGPLRALLSEVLHIYCALPGSLPYRQGMSHLAAVLLLHLQEPALTCASLSSLLGGYPILRACASLHLRPGTS
jgi:hypothetical protein